MNYNNFLLFFKFWIPFVILYGSAQFNAQFMFLVKVGPSAEWVEMNRIICEDEGCAVPEKTFVVLKRDDKLYKNKQTFLYTEGFEHAYHVPSKTKFQEMIYLSPQF